ncbi:hypothetical protein Tco_0731035 [Tanacetum coccineum]
MHETHASLVTKKVADIAESKETEDDEVQPLIRRSTGVVIGREILKRSAEDALDHFQKLKGIETLSATAQFVPDLKTTTKAIRLDYDISGSSSSSLFGFDDETKDISSDKKVKADEHKAKEGKEIEEQVEDEQPVDEHARGKQVEGEQAKVHELEPAVPNPSSSLTLTSTEYGNQFINENPDVSINDILKDSIERDIRSMMDVPIHQEDPAVQRTPLVDVVILVITEKTTSTPTPPITQPQVSNASESEPSLKFKHIISEHEKKVDALSKNPISLFKSSSSSTSIDSFTEYELKNMLYDKMQKSGSFNEHEKLLDLYTTLIGSIHLDEAFAKGEIDPTKAGKTPSKPSSTGKSVNAEETVHEVTIEADESMEVEDVMLVNAEKDPLTFDDLMGSTIDFTKFSMHRLKKNKITKADLRGPTYKLLKETCRNNIELGYNLEQCYLALSDKLDWANPEGDRCPFDLSKPLTLKDYQGRLIIPVNFFFNNDLEYLKTRNISDKDKGCKKAELEIHHWGPKCQLFYRSRNIATLHHEVFSRLKIPSVIRISVDKQFGYGYLNEIVVRRADQKKHTFREAYFSRLHLNDIEDVCLLYVQHKLHSLTDDEIVDLVISLRMFTQSIVIKRRVEDVQLGVNIIRPQTKFDGISSKEPYTIVYEPKGVLYLNKSNRKRLMRADELY